MTEKTRVHIFVSGRVQGVFFRASTKKKAKKFGLTGWVGNLFDGRVEIVIEGEKSKTNKIIEWLKKGPFLAKVKNIEIKNEEYKDEFNNFEIRY